ncbi:cobalamin biosynthesis protein [Sulfitobacter sp. F26169L]|uniref:cobalamin biosynthesis protein n=1 Tax=Sulfitobacter sp. F26169L TaxID=2996015 RepID=UPI002260DEA4|nr:cobalamin biosynthesis protein [Sulfitobacter sp. F26169L]MCX7567111.1 cobalamin biosynthesis protein [Sulfitobacter sp. F26169L]
MECGIMIVAGLGFRVDADLNSLRTALLLACQERLPDILATAAGKEESAALRALADELALSVTAVPLAQLRAQSTLTHSPTSQAAYGTGSVAEAAALAAVGPNGRLLGQRHISPDRMATCAFAQGHGK